MSTRYSRTRFRITQASEYGRAYRPAELTAMGELAQARGWGFHVDGARFANAAAFLGCSPAEAVGPADALSFGCVKNGGMSAEAIVFFDPELADVARYRRKRAGHLQSKGRFLAAQLLAMLDGDLWLENARAANAAAQALARTPAIACCIRWKRTRCSCAARRQSGRRCGAKGSVSTTGARMPRGS